MTDNTALGSIISPVCMLSAHVSDRLFFLPLKWFKPLLIHKNKKVVGITFF